jgi:phosphate:Na+ symporter
VGEFSFQHLSTEFVDELLSFKLMKSLGADKHKCGLPGGIAVMLGAELGTCADTLLATIQPDREAIKTGLFHPCFNIITIVIGLLFFNPSVALVTAVSSNASLQQVATAHMLFNVLGVVLFLPFISQ